MSRQQTFNQTRRSGSTGFESQNSTKKQERARKKNEANNIYNFFYIGYYINRNWGKNNWLVRALWNKINDWNVERKGREGNREWERLPTDLYLNICSCVCWCVGMQECIFVFGFCQFRLWSVKKVWLQIHWPQAHFHKHTLQITGHFSHNSAVQTSHSPETHWKTMFPLGLPLNSIQCVYSAAVLTV